MSAARSFIGLLAQGGRWIYGGGRWRVDGREMHFMAPGKRILHFFCEVKSCGGEVNKVGLPTVRVEFLSFVFLFFFQACCGGVID